MNQRVRFDTESPLAWWFFARRADYQAPRLANAAGIGVAQLRRLCRDFWGESLEGWLQDQGLLAARQLLAEGKSVTETSNRLDVRSSTHFPRIFRATFGCSPREHFRRFSDQR